MERFSRSVPGHLCSSKAGNVVNAAAIVWNLGFTPIRLLVDQWQNLLLVQEISRKEHFYIHYT